MGEKKLLAAHTMMYLLEIQYLATPGWKGGNKNAATPLKQANSTQIVRFAHWDWLKPAP
jgi:hypothetical protein